MWRALQPRSYALTWPWGAYEGATVLGKQALLMMPLPSPFRYKMLSGGGAVAVLHQRRMQLVNVGAMGPSKAKLLRAALCMAGSATAAWLGVSALGFGGWLAPGQDPALPGMGF